SPRLFLRDLLYSSVISTVSTRPSMSLRAASVTARLVRLAYFASFSCLTSSRSSCSVFWSERVCYKVYLLIRGRAHGLQTGSAQWGRQKVRASMERVRQSDFNDLLVCAGGSAGERPSFFFCTVAGNTHSACQPCPPEPPIATIPYRVAQGTGS